MGAEDDLLGIERAGADVPVHDAERAQGEDRPPGMSDDVALVVGRGLQRGGRPGRLRGRGWGWAHRPVPELVCRFVKAPAHAGSRGAALAVAPAGRSQLVRGLVVAVPRRRRVTHSVIVCPGGSSAAATARSRLPRAPRCCGAYRTLLPSVRRVRRIATPGAVTGSGASRRRTSALSTTRAARTSSAFGLMAALSPGP